MSVSHTGSKIGLIWAQSEGGVIGLDGVMPWHLPEDLAHFKQITLGCPVIMGRKTWDSLPERFRPLPGRRNIVVTRDAEWSADGAEAVSDPDEALKLAAEGLTADEWVWVIGGAQVFAQIMDRADRIELTEINADFEGDSFAPQPDERWAQVAGDPASGWHTSATELEFRFLTYQRADR